MVPALSPPDALPIGTSGSGVFKSTDGGGSWSAANTGLPTPVSVTTLANDPLTPTPLYAVTRGGRVIKSTNGGGGRGAPPTRPPPPPPRRAPQHRSPPRHSLRVTGWGWFQQPRGGGWRVPSPSRLLPLSYSGHRHGSRSFPPRRSPDRD